MPVKDLNFWPLLDTFDIGQWKFLIVPNLTVTRDLGFYNVVQRTRKASCLNP